MTDFFKISETLIAGRYICMSPVVNIPPFYGSKKECTEACVIANREANYLFLQLAPEEKTKILNLLKSICCG